MKVMALLYSMGKVSKGNVFWDNKHKFIVSSSEAFSTLSGKRTSLQNLFHRGRLFSFWSRFGSVEKVHSTWIDDAVVSHQEKRHFYSFLDIFPAFVNFGYVWHNANHTIGAPAEKVQKNNKPQTIVCSSQYGFAYMAIISVQVVTSAVGTMKNI